MFIQKIYTYVKNKKASPKNNSVAPLYNMDNCPIEDLIPKSKITTDLKHKKITKLKTQSNYKLKKSNPSVQSSIQLAIDFNSEKSEHPKYNLRSLLSEINDADKQSIRIEKNLREYIESRKNSKNQQVEAYKKSLNKFEKLLDILINKIKKENSIQNHIIYLATINRFNEDYKLFTDNK